MDGGDGGDDRRFTINFSCDGVSKLREVVKGKLQDFLADYTDDTLVEYVIVLLKNGRRKAEAKSELDVFLGDDSDPFVTWLWDHLGSSLHVYSQSSSIQLDEVGNVEAAAQEPARKNEPHKMESESEEGRSKILSKIRHRRQWKGLAGETEENQIRKSSIPESDPLKEDSLKNANIVKPRDSQHEGAQRKRLRSEALGSNKVLSRSVARGSSKEGLHQATMVAPRRLLQFAVRDAVAAPSPSILNSDPSSKRLQSVVFESRRPVTRVSSNMSTVIKAVAEAAEDVKRVGPLHDVFDRLSGATGVYDISEQLTDLGEDFSGDRYVQPHHSSRQSDFREQYVSDTILLPIDTEMALESGFEYDGYNDMEIRDRGYEDFSGDIHVQPHHSSHQYEFKEEYASDTFLVTGDTELSPESGFEYDEYNHTEIRGRVCKNFSGDRYVQHHHSSYRSEFDEQYVSDSILLPRDTEMAPESLVEYHMYNDMEIRGRESNDVSLSSEVLRKEAEDSLMFSYDLAHDTDVRSQETVSSMSAPDASRKMVTWESPQYREARENVKLDSGKSKAENSVLAAKLNAPPTKASKECAMLGNGTVQSEAGIVKESHKLQFTHDPCSTGTPADEPDSRTIFVSNVHFAATKDSLSRNFNKFGEVLKVIILSNPATGLPKGSAYVEFMRKKEAEHALSLDGTSFMSRILKVVRKNASPPEASSTLGWPRAARSSPYPISGYSTTPFARGVPNVYSACPRKPGARSFQWKRDMNSMPNQMSNRASNTSLPAAPRGLTYIRQGPKTNGISN